MGRPKLPNSKVTKWALWKRAQRETPTGKGRGFVQHHRKGVRNDEHDRVVLSRSEHAKVDNPMKKAIKGRVKDG